MSTQQQIPQLTVPRAIPSDDAVIPSPNMPYGANRPRVTFRASPQGREPAWGYRLI